MSHDALKAALESRIPDLSESYKRNMRSQFKWLVSLYGESMDNISNGKQYHLWSDTVRPVCYVTNPTTGCRRPSDPKPTWAIKEEALERRAEEYAKSTALAWFDKIAGKMGNLTDAKCLYAEGMRYIITGMKGDNTVRIEQDMILNVSSKGRVFNQFPSRIYCNGKFISEAKFKDKFGEI